jgi:hypothetical protein
VTADHSDADYVRVLRPRRVARLLFDLVRLRTSMRAYQMRGETMIAVTEALCASGRGGLVRCREFEHEWSVAVLPAGGLIEAR